MSAAEPLIPRKIWTREEFDLLPSETLSLELIEGELIDRMGKRPPHIYWQNLVHAWLLKLFGHAYTRSEAPIDVAPEENPTSEPEPDVSVTYQSLLDTEATNPRPEDLRLVVEISDKTYQFDLTVKAPLYARAGIRECWVVDIRIPKEPRLIVHLEPRDGRYEQIVSYRHDEDAAVLEGQYLRLNRLREAG